MSSNPFEEWDDVLEADWTAEQERAWNVFRNAEVGEQVIWGSRANPLTINERNWTDGLIELEVEGPRGGSYTLRERYERGEPKYYADDSKANDLRFADEDLEEGDRLSTSEYEDLVVTLETQSLNTFSTGSFSTYREAVRRVVDSWSADVQFGSWSGMDGSEESTAVFNSVIEYSPHLKDTYDTTRPLQYQAEQHLIDTIVERSEQDADLSLVRDERSYDEFVDDTAATAIDRLSTSRYESASLAARDAASNAVEGHSEEFYRNIIKFSDREPMEYDFYAEEEGSEQYQEMAFDVLTDDVRERVREIRRSQGSHDPRPAGLRWEQYDRLAESLVEQSIREHRINDNRLVRATVEDAVGNWVDTVESGNFEMDGTEFDAVDSEDVFGSVALHSVHEPSGFNPFSESSMRETAFDVLVEDVTNRYENAVEMEDAEPIPADKYLSEELGFDFTYDDIRNDQDLSTEDFIRETLRQYDGDWDQLTGFTFVDELVEAGGFNVPRFSSEWILVDYGLVERDNRLRRLAWFHREDGSVIGLTGITSDPPEEGEYTFEDFGVYIMRWDDPEPEYLLSDVSIQEAMEFLYDRLGGNSANVQLIETKEGEYWVKDTFESEDLDGGTLIGNVAPGLDIPGVGLIPEAVRRRGSGAFERVTDVAREKMSLQEDAKRYSILLFMELAPYFAQKVAYGTEIQPTYHQKRGVGIEIMNTIGADPDQKGVGGNVQGEFYIRPESLRSARDNLLSGLWSLGDSSVDVSFVEEKVNNIIEHYEDRTAEARATYLMLFFPRRPRGGPQSKLKAVSKRYNSQNDDGYGDNVWYTLNPGESLDDGELRERIEFAREYGIGKVFLDEGEWSDHPYGLMDFSTVENIDDDGNQAGQKQLPIELAEEVGWSLTASKAFDLFGSEDSVERGNSVGTYDDFLELYEHFSYVPEKSVVGQGFRWLIEEGRSSDQFTLVDAYDAFRTSLVFDKQEQIRNEVFAELIEGGTIDPEMVFSGGPGETHERYLDMGFPEGGVQFVWDFGNGSPFANVFDGKNLGDVEQILMASGRNGYGATHYWVHEGEDDRYSKYENRLNSDRSTDFDDDGLMHYLGGPENGPAQTIVVVGNADQLWEYADSDAKQFVREEVCSRGLFESAPDGEDLEDDFSKWLDGTSLSIGGVFLNGLSAAANLNNGTFMSGRDLFPLQLNDIPGVNFEPSRPDIPSFSEWRRTRRGLTSEVSESRERGRYLREISDFTRPSFRQMVGFSEESEFESQADQEAAMADGDYENYEHFYADEFGESFEDVESRFTSGDPIEGDAELSSEGVPDIDDED